ncbi:MAG: hypothetical protein K8R67_17650 [Desulfobacteraceae bacterium]|nr:hypothetical protein [Desulfobacteraceae bacterium]
MEEKLEKNRHDLSNETITELESVGIQNIEYYKNEGKKHLLLGLGSLLIGTPLFIYVGFFDRRMDHLIAMSLFFLSIGIMIYGLWQISQAIKKLYFKPPVAPTSIETLLNTFYDPLLHGTEKISWLKQYVCLIKKERDRIGTYPEYIKYRKENTIFVRKELSKLIKTLKQEGSSHEVDHTIYFILDEEHDNVFHYNIQFNVGIFTGFEGSPSSGQQKKRIGNICINEMISLCKMNDKYYIVDSEWTGKPKIKSKNKEVNIELHSKEALETLEISELLYIAKERGIQFKETTKREDLIESILLSFKNQ